MRATFIVAAHQLRRVVRNPGLILLLLAIPLTLAVMEYGAFGRSAAEGKLPPVKVLFLDEDDTVVSGFLPQVFSGGPAKDFFELAQVPDKQEAARLFTRNQAAALIVVPRGFQDALLANRPAELVFYRNPIQSIGPDIVASMLQMTTLIGNGLYAKALEPIRQVKALLDAGRDPTSAEVAAISQGFFEAGRRLQGLDALTNLRIGVQRPGDTQARTGFGSDPAQFFAYVFPGLVVFALMFIAQALAIRLLRDRLKGLQRRIVMTPVSPLAVVLGGVTYLVVGLLVLLVFLGVIGGLVFRIPLRDPLSLLAIGLGFALFAAGLHLLSISLSKSDRSAGFVGSVVVLVLSLLGGTFVPAEQYPPFLQRVAAIVPNGAAQQGFIDVLVHKMPLVGLGPGLGVVWAWGIVTMALAVFVERRRLRA
ncbi:MAG: ABC transporter permease [Acidobacteria bacterium]|nr:ABC transporter permease [Acidobacteriota bacterium]